MVGGMYVWNDTQGWGWPLIVKMVVGWMVGWIKGVVIV